MLLSPVPSQALHLRLFINPRCEQSLVVRMQPVKRVPWSLGWSQEEGMVGCPCSGKGGLLGKWVPGILPRLSQVGMAVSKSPQARVSTARLSISVCSSSLMTPLLYALQWLPIVGPHPPFQSHQVPLSLFSHPFHHDSRPSETL